MSDTFYIVPALLSSVSGINEKMSIAFALFFSVSSWIYLCIILIFIIVINIRQLLTKIQKEMNMVYHSGLYFTKMNITICRLKNSLKQTI